MDVNLSSQKTVITVNPFLLPFVSTGDTTEGRGGEWPDNSDQEHFGCCHFSPVGLWSGISLFSMNYYKLGSKADEDLGCVLQLYLLPTFF